MEHLGACLEALLIPDIPGYVFYESNWFKTSIFICITFLLNLDMHVEYLEYFHVDKWLLSYYLSQNEVTLNTMVIETIN